jgi:hypothetical protein
MEPPGGQIPHARMGQLGDGSGADIGYNRVRQTKELKQCSSWCKEASVPSRGLFNFALNPQH